MNQQWNDWKLENHTLIYWKSCHLYFKIFVIFLAVHAVSFNCPFSYTNTFFWTARVGCRSCGLLHFIEVVKRYPKEKNNSLSSERRFQQSDVWGDSKMSAVCETSGGVLVLFAPTAPVKVKSPLWTPFELPWQLVIWKPPNPSQHWKLLSCSTKRPPFDGDHVPLRRVTERRWDLQVRGLRYGWLSYLDSAFSVSSSRNFFQCHADFAAAVYIQHTQMFAWQHTLDVPMSVVLVFFKIQESLWLVLVKRKQ